MKKAFLLAALISIFYFLISILPLPVFAQGYYKCNFDPTGPPLDLGCKLINLCDKGSGYEVPSSDDFMCNLVLPWKCNDIPIKTCVCDGKGKCANSLFVPQTPCGDITNDSNLKTKCEDCMNNPLYVWTAIGCLHAGDPNKFIGQILGWSTIVGAGIAFLLIVFGGIQISTAAGDPKRVKAAQELITAAIMGLLLIIFSIFLLNLIGLNILNLNPLGLPTGNP